MTSRPRRNSTPAFRAKVAIAAVLDEETREAVGDAVFKECLAEQMAAAMIQWHWS
jgi:hypothetical protein